MANLLSDVDKIRAALGSTVSDVLGRLQSVAGTGNEVERIALNAVHEALAGFAGAIDAIVSDEKAVAGEPASKTPAQAAKDVLAAKPPAAK